jgi:hypothetical protein
MRDSRLSFADLMLDEDEFLELLITTRLRILGVFMRATEPDPRRRVLHAGTARHRGSERHSDNAIVGCGDNKIGSLAHYVLRELGRRRGNTIFETEDVDPRAIQSFGPKLLALRLGDLEHELVAQVLCVMRDLHEIYFLYERGGIWQAAQSAVDDHRKWRRTARRLRGSKGFIDLRNYHGRPRRQTKSRGIPGGTSVGASRQGSRRLIT